MRQKILIMGASGLVGTATALEFHSAGYEVISVSRRVPELLSQDSIKHFSIDLQDKSACSEFIKNHCLDVTHLVYTAVYELPGLIKGWTDSKQIDTNGSMFKNVLEPLSKTGKLRHVTLLQGTKAYGLTVGPIRTPARESQDRVVHPNFYWVQEDFLRSQSGKQDFDYTIMRPQLIVGPNHGVVMNIPPVIGIYGAIRKELGQPFSFPGGPIWVWEAVDVRLVAQAIRWATENSIASGKTYNLTNGEVFSFRDMWPRLAQTLGLEVGEDDLCLLSDFIPKNKIVWEAIVKKYGLRDIGLDNILGESHFYADMCFASNLEEAPPPTFVSSIKIREHGFNQVWNTEESFCYWLEDLQKRKVLPLYS